MAKAYITSLPNTTDTQRTFVKTVDSPKVPAMDYRSGFKDVATAIDNTNKFLDTFSKMKYEGFQADLDRLELEHLHEMQDATDPCQLEQINEKWKKNYDSALKDDFWAKSYYKSQYYKNWQARNQEAQQKLYFAKQHEFAEICAADTLNKMAETASLLSNPNDVEQYIRNGEAMLAQTEHLTAENKYKLMSNFYKDTVSRLYNSDPNKAVAFLNSVGNKYDGYGVSSEEIKKKAENYNKAKAREARADIAAAQRIKDNYNKALAAQIKSRILQNPSEAESIIDSVSDNDSVFVNVSDWYRKGIGKNTNRDRSPLSQTITSELVSGKAPQEVFESHPELINDPNAANALKNAIDISKKLNPSEKEDMAKKVKGELAGLDTEESFYNYIASPENLTKANVYAPEALKNVGNLYGYGKNNEVDSLKSEILNASTLEEVESLRNSVVESNLAPKDKNTLFEKLNTRENNIRSRLNSEELKQQRAENKAYREEQRAEKKSEKQRKAESTEAYGRILSAEPLGVRGIEEQIDENFNLLTPEDKNKAQALYNKVHKTENKESKALAKDLLKSNQQRRFNELNQMRREGILTQDIIDTEQENGNISLKQADKLSEELYKQSEKSVKEQRKLDIDADKTTIYTNALDNKPTDEGDIKTSDPTVLALLKTTNATVNRKNYERELANIQDEIWQNPNPNEETVSGYVDRLVAKNIDELGSPMADVQKIIKQVGVPEFDKIKNLKEQLSVKMTSPLSGEIYKSFIERQNAKAVNEMIGLVNQGKDVDIDRIAEQYRPTLESWQKDSFNRDNAYFNLYGMKQNMFEQINKKDKSGKLGTSYKVAKGYDAKDYLYYEQTLNDNKESLTPKQYDELIKPVVVNKAWIYNNLAEDTKSIEGMVAHYLKENYGGNYINDVNKFSNDFWQSLAYVEEQLGKARTEKPFWGMYNYSKVQGFVRDWFKANKSQYYSNTLEDMK